MLRGWFSGQFRDCHNVRHAALALPYAAPCVRSCFSYYILRGYNILRRTQSLRCKCQKNSCSLFNVCVPAQVIYCAVYVSVKVICCAGNVPRS